MKSLKGVSTKGVFLWGLLLFVLVVMVGCGGGGGSGGGGGGGDGGGGTNDPALIGRWKLSTLNGQPFSETVTFTSSTYTLVTPLCTSAGIYSTYGDLLILLTSTVSGSVCGGVVAGDSATLRYTVTPTTLTMRDEEGTTLLVYIKDPSSGGGGGGGTNNPALIGRWKLSTVNGQPFSVTVTFTSSTYTAVAPFCTEQGRYSTSGDLLMLTTSGVSGSGCGGVVVVGDSRTARYTVTPTTLTTWDEEGNTLLYTRVGL